MKAVSKIRNLLVNGICTSTSLTEGVQMVAVLEVIFAAGFMIHGGYLCSQAHAEAHAGVYGVLYILSGLIYWTLTWLLWMTSENPTCFRCRSWIMSSLFNQFFIIILTVTRNSVQGSEKLWSANIWILTGLFLQCYMITVVWAFMLHHLDSINNKENTDNANVHYRPNDGPGEGSIVSTDFSDNDRNSTVVSL